MTQDATFPAVPTVIHNPILRGFNPDPSIVRVGADYYIATSTFEWFPGVRLHHSRDLVRWTTIGHALTDPAAFDLRGIPDSGGVWAPSLSYADGRFWLAYSVVRTMDSDNKDIDNYLVTSATIHGPWSEPVYLGSRGFDVSFFHDTDGSHWIVGVQWDARPEHPSFAGLVLERYDPVDRHVVGGPTTLLRADTLIEGPNLYHEGGWYYLLIAQGGTGWNHGVATARSRVLTGPYETDPQTSVLTSRDNATDPLQKAGHGELVQTQSGEWLLVHLASRPVEIDGVRFCITGRETSIQRVVWTSDGWLRLVGGGVNARTEVDATGLGSAPPQPHLEPSRRDDFDATVLDSRRFSTLRMPLGADVLSLTARPGWLRLKGGHSTGSVFEQSFVAQRIEENTVRAETLVDATPTDHAQAAGLIAWYDRHTWVWGQVTWDEESGRQARLVWRDLEGTGRSEAVTHLPGGPVGLRFELSGGFLHFSVSDARGSWRALGPARPGWQLSDDYGGGNRFTGAFAGLRAEDLNGTGWIADFDFFSLTSSA